MPHAMRDRWSLELERGGAVANVDEDEDEDEEAALRRQHIRRIEVRRGIEILLGPFSC